MNGRYSLDAFTEPFDNCLFMNGEIQFRCIYHTEPFDNCVYSLDGIYHTEPFDQLVCIWMGDTV